MNETDIYEMAITAIGHQRFAADAKKQIDGLRAEIADADAEAAALRAKIAEAMADEGHQEISGPGVIVTYRKAGAPAVVITDESALPAEYMVTPPVPADRPDKNAIKAALKRGETVPGAVLSNPAPSISIKEIGRG